MQGIDDIDVQILSKLQDDARQGYGDIARELQVTEGTIYNRITRLKELGVIRRFIADIDFSKLGYDIDVVIGVVADSKHLPAIGREISKESAVRAVYDVAGEYSAIVVAKCMGRDGLSVLVRKILAIPGVGKVYTLPVLQLVKDDYGVRLSGVKKRDVK
jgi:Lrp/AsnC family transcriptional regulator for asnA, asnC and gidA